MSFLKKVFGRADLSHATTPERAEGAPQWSREPRRAIPARFAVRRASSSPRASRVFPVFLGGGASRQALAFKPRLRAFPREGASLLATGMRQDTMKHMDMDKSLSNKERFDKLKESRQKYKDEAARQREEARSANQKMEALEKQLRMLGGRWKRARRRRRDGRRTPIGSTR